MIVALSKPANHSQHTYGDTDSTAPSYTYSDKLSDISKQYQYGYDRKLAPNEWRCQKCGRANANYVGTCACGNTKD